MKKKELLKKQFESSQRDQAAKMEEARQLGGGSGGSARGSGDSVESVGGVGGKEGGKEERKEMAKEETVEHVQVIDLDHMGEEEGEMRATPMDTGEVKVEAVSPHPRDDAATFSVMYLPKGEDRQPMDQDLPSVVMVTDTDVDCTMEESTSSQGGDEGEEVESKGEPRLLKEDPVKRAKSLKDTEATKKKDKALEAAKKREEAEKKRRQLTEAVREKLEEERRKKEEAAKKQQKMHLTLTKKGPGSIKPPSSSSASIKGAKAGEGKKKDEKNFTKTAPAGLQGLGLPPPVPTRPNHATWEGEITPRMMLQEEEKLSSSSPAPPAPVVLLPPPIPARVQPPLPPPTPKATAQPPPTPAPAVNNPLPTPTSPDSAMNSPPARTPLSAMPPPPTLPIHLPTTPAPVLQVKAPHHPSPTSYAFSPAPAPLVAEDSNNYPMSDHSEVSDEEANTSPSSRDKRVPSWAREPSLSMALRAQATACVDPDLIFPPIDPYQCSLDEIFKGYKKKKNSKFRDRTSSGNWGMDMLSAREEMAYKREMGYLKG